MSSWIEGMFRAGALPAMEQSIRFAEARHRLVLHNVANADTPNYRRKDLDVGLFHRTLSSETARIEEAREPRDAAGVLRHDGNDVSLEMELALLARNAAQHNRMATLLAKSLGQIRQAIAERPSAG